MQVQKYLMTIGIQGKVQIFQFIFKVLLLSVQFSSVAQLCLTLCDPMNRSTPGLPVHY